MVMQIVELSNKTHNIDVIFRGSYLGIAARGLPEVDQVIEEYRRIVPSVSVSLYMP